MDKDTGAFKAIYFTDLMRAFEFVKPDWIREVLKARGASRWLRTVVGFFIRPRKAIPKILDKKLTPIQILVGVDMGNALAPWIFCVATDPIIRHLHRIPNSITNGYTDDATSVVDAIKALKQVQETWKCYKATGLSIAEHTCIGHKDIWGNTTKGSSFVIDWDRPQTRQGRDVETLDNENDLAEIIAKQHRIKCSCRPKFKTAIILRRSPTSDQLAGINDTPQGPLILCNNAKNLGLMVHSNRPWRENAKNNKISKAAKIEMVYHSYIQLVKEKVRRY